MTDTELWRELGQQLRVDSIRCAAVPKSGHPTSSMSAADLMAVLLAKYLQLRLRQPGRPAQRPPDLLEGPRVAAALLDVQGGGCDHRRGAADVPQVRLAARGTSDAEDPVGRRRDGLARAGPADRGRRRAGRQEARPAPLPRLVPVRRQRARGGIDVGGVRARRVRRARQPGGDPRHQPPRPARRDDARLGSRLVHAPRRGVRLGRDRDRRPRRRGDRPRLRRGALDDRPADGDRRADDQGQRRQGGREPAGTGTASRSTIPRPQSRSSAANGTSSCRCTSPKATGSLTSSRPARSSCRPTSSATEVGDAQGVRRRAARARQGPRRRRRARRRGLELDLRGRVREGASRSATSRCTSPSSSWSPPRSACRCATGSPFASTFAAFFSRAYDFIRMAAISQANIRLCGSHAGVSIGEDGPSQMALEDLAVAPGRARLDRPLPVRREPDGEARRRDGRPRRDLVHAHDARRTPR